MLPSHHPKGAVDERIWCGSSFECQAEAGRATAQRSPPAYPEDLDQSDIASALSKLEGTYKDGNVIYKEGCKSRQQPVQVDVRDTQHVPHLEEDEGYT